MLYSLILFIFGVLLVIFGAYLGIRYSTNPLPTIFIVIGMIISFGAIIQNVEGNKPTALDVYRGNTTLQITYRDSIPIDTVVVFKN